MMCEDGKIIFVPIQKRAKKNKSVSACISAFRLGKLQIFEMAYLRQHLLIRLCSAIQGSTGGLEWKETKWE